MVRHTGFEPATSWEGGAVRDLCDLLCKMFLGVSCLRGFLGAGPSRLTSWNEEESFSQKIAKITKTIPWVESQHRRAHAWLARN